MRFTKQNFIRSFLIMLLVCLTAFFLFPDKGNKEKNKNTSPGEEKKVFQKSLNRLFLG